MTITAPAIGSGKAKAYDVKYIGDLVGCYALSSRENYLDGPRIFSCRSRSITPTMAVLQAPVAGAVGESLGLKLDVLGLMRASINRLLPGGFAVDLLLSEPDRALLAARLDWLKRRQLQAVDERRHARRWLPHDPHSVLILAGGVELPCFIADVSVSGAAVSADAAPAIGEPVVVGAVLARTVRRTEGGFAVQFLEEQKRSAVEQLLAPPPQSRHDMLVELLEAAEKAVVVPAAAGTAGGGGWPGHARP